MKEDEVLLAGIEDKISQCLENYMVTNSTFLDMRQRTLAEALCRQHKGLRCCFYGGYEDAERTVVIFLPDYAELADHDPLALLRITQSGQRALSHRDYLGALMGLGIKREIIGDILVRENGADIVIIREMGDFLLYNYEKAGRTSLKAEIVSIGEIIVPENRFEEKRDTVASLRLDNLVASAFSLSRGRAAEAVEGGMVFVNGLQIDKADRQIKEGDKLVLRGKGKVLLKAVGGVTKKDRISIVLHKYI
jgi:RNA-binding protein YlmH